jgi:ABC-type bacteriocin/lantibiotic exporter with double-glycine peptidase domain
MSTGLPHYRQEKKNTCALACLRMVLASFGTYVEEDMLQGEAHMEADGTGIAELERLARQFGLVADIEEATVEQLRHLPGGGEVADRLHRPRHL